MQCERKWRKRREPAKCIAERIRNTAINGMQNKSGFYHPIQSFLQRIVVHVHVLVHMQMNAIQWLGLANI